MYIRLHGSVNFFVKFDQTISINIQLIDFYSQYYFNRKHTVKCCTKSSHLCKLNIAFISKLYLFILYFQIETKLNIVLFSILQQLINFDLYTSVAGVLFTCHSCCSNTSPKFRSGSCLRKVSLRERYYFFLVATCESSI